MEPRDDLVPMMMHMMMEMFKKRRKSRSGHDSVMSCLAFTATSLPGQWPKSVRMQWRGHKSADGHSAILLEFSKQGKRALLHSDLWTLASHRHQGSNDWTPASVALCSSDRTDSDYVRCPREQCIMPAVASATPAWQLYAA